jgi:hypothetical protein
LIAEIFSSTALSIFLRSEFREPFQSDETIAVQIKKKCEQRCPDSRQRHHSVH